ncbi:unnamed protein product [Mytilus coruscus]|uniref:Reverse transcriptase domain-containing protein n=1 Tax=Mytilus coruscus TaxID=42192 RepID=A0A6J8CHV0_MYTCO|nr:unnamed protein product [Mytilus coruscus]
MPPATYLKRRHDLKSVNNMGLKLLKKCKDIRIPPRTELGRVKSLVRTEDLSDDDCKRHFTSITGEDAAQILELATAPVNGDNLKKLLHVTVILANEIGKPAGEDLRHVENEDSGDEDPSPKKKNKNHDLLQRVADLEKSKEDNDVNTQNSGFPHLSTPEWEKKAQFDPRSTFQHIRKHTTWVTLDGDKPANAVHHITKLDILTLQYIDDRLLITSGKPHLPHGNINTISYALVELLTRLGYTLSIKKSRFDPSQSIKFLGFFIDSEHKCFHLPSDKKLSFIALRELILKSEKVSVKTLQRFAGKCVSMNLAIPAAILFCREVNAAISSGIKNSRDVNISGDLKRGRSNTGIF